MRQLAWIGRQRSRAMAALVPVAILLPPLGAVLEPHVTEAVVGLLCIAFLRLDPAALRACLRRPWIVIGAALWTSFLIPLLLALGGRFLALEAVMPALFTGLMLQAVTSPMMAAPALAALMGLDATLVLAAMIACTALVPVSAPLLAAIAGLDLPLSPLVLGARLLAVLAGSALVGLALRRILGPAFVARRHEEIDGVNILLLFVFVSAVMGDVGVRFLADPMAVLALTAVAFAVFALLLAATCAVFATAGAKRALALGMMCAQRNMGLMLAGTGGVLPDLTWLYFALAQLPIYLSPLVLQPVAGRIGRGT